MVYHTIRKELNHKKISKTLNLNSLVELQDINKPIMRRGKEPSSYNYSFMHNILGKTLFMRV